jgi:pSer/pThr/pTyr-binding forkhead associated (FHA) protein
MRIVPNAPAAKQNKLQLTFGESTLHLFTEGNALTMGRSAECSLVVATAFASRLHARVVMRRGKFVLVDESTNGTYIVPDSLDSGGPEIFIKREEFILPAKGVISLGQSCSPAEARLIHFLVLGAG